MKRICTLAMMVVLAVVTFKCRAGVEGSINFKFVATYQDIANRSTNTTHTTSTVTNSVQTSISTTTNATLNNNKLLRLLANSFNTNFPAGAALKLDEFAHVVVAVGTNIVLYPSNVLVINPMTNGVFSDKILVAVKTAPSGSTVHVVTRAIVHNEASLDYDDSLLTTRDGNTTRFSAKGVLTEHDSSHVENGVGTFPSTLMFSGSGSGTISNSVSHTRFILRGGFTGRLVARTSGAVE